MKNLVSVVIPVYNQEKYILRCLESVRKQTYTNFEVIIVNDGSTDSSGRLCDDFASNDVRFTVVHIPNAGVSNARNIGIDNSKGTYISFLDADDYWHPDFLCNLLDPLEENKKCQIALSSFYRVFGNSQTPQKQIHLNEGVVNIMKEYDYGKDYTLRHIWGAVYEKKALKQTRFRRNIYVGEDSLFMAELIVNNPYIHFVNKPLYYYSCFESSSSHGKMDAKKATVAEAWNEIITTYKMKDCSPQFMAGVYTAFFNECKDGMRKIEMIQHNQNGLSKVFMNPIKHRIIEILKSSLTNKDKLLYIFFSISPKGYLKWEKYRYRGK